MMPQYRLQRIVQHSTKISWANFTAVADPVTILTLCARSTVREPLQRDSMQTVGPQWSKAVNVEYPFDVGP
jgi:hypothetical protein